MTRKRQEGKFEQKKEINQKIIKIEIMTDERIAKVLFDHSQG